MNFLHVEEAKYLYGYQVWLRFNDGTEGEANLESSLTGPVFEPLQDTNIFKKFRLEGHTLTWDNGADFAPEYLKSKVSNPS